MNTDATRFLDTLELKHARFYQAAIEDLFVASVENNKGLALAAREQLAEAIAETMGAAEVLGAVSVLRVAARELHGTALPADAAMVANFAKAPAQSIIPRVTLAEALEDMVDRAPVTVRRAADRTAQAIAKLYSKGRVVAFVRSAEAKVTKAVQQFIANAMRRGIDEGTAGRRLAMKANEIRKKSKEWTEGYARMVYRTNVNTAVTAGRFRQTRDPDVKAVVPAFRFDAIGDSDTRDNHEAANGLIFSVDNPVWNRIAPPLGYNCRCQVSHVTRMELEMAGRIDKRGNVKQDRLPAGAFPDEGFRHGNQRPDLGLFA